LAMVPIMTEWGIWCAEYNCTGQNIT